MSVFTEEQIEYLQAHKWAVLATGKRDGSPQVSQIGYEYNGTAIDQDPLRAELTTRVFRVLSSNPEFEETMISSR